MQHPPYQRKPQKKITQPLHAFFTLFTEKTQLEIWLVENDNLRIQGKLAGFDEYLNLVLDRAVEYDRKTKATKELGKILLKGENIVLVRTLEDVKL
ncbi:unnamed protein product [Paramecium primaurelia]|uniref:Small nuclear ribonucleoprotein E n=5 Tax=Paramecium TaxID=5884 RepID=A0C1J5_PARTE|nr:uncharacterized protein GSPATT00034139001 [Paramecium tetraurelia]XP_001435488.1 uncharacterized protein GSPATT00036874001 [Paramecium tetraurelia]CAD8072625.1 unnamed protein product [Paramecium primaurelia]CAD8122877.1 unnamed protein product [Paramecium sonneborni]CAD8165090.1 unnamed protein product [Paramecium pentaurelia]CAD8212753.1 unnamed protein product [Paramecium octaurelia]CAD8101459.1 unnamed protein product [Paramecium primaurelia]|eukprot:XP_001432059.1 hypothetical protein (macronuclear) [Paramecium tetraurelia strain d4-2]